MSEAEVNGRAFLQALMSLKNKCHIKGRLLKHFGWAVLPASLPSKGVLPFQDCQCLHHFVLVGLSPLYFSSNLFLSGIFQFTTQTCEIRTVLLFAPNIPQQMDLHQVQTVTNFELLFPVSAEKFPSCLGDLACCSLCLLFYGSPLFSAFSSYCPGHLQDQEAKKKRPSCLCRKDYKLERGERCSRRIFHAGPSQPHLRFSAPSDAAGSDVCDHISQRPRALAADTIDRGRHTGIAGVEAAWRWDCTRGDS